MICECTLKYWHANKASWAIFSCFQIWYIHYSLEIKKKKKKSLESRPGFHSAKLGHKHTHNLSGISSSITKKHSFFCVKLGSHEACKKNKVLGFKKSQNRKLHNNQSYLSVIIATNWCQIWKHRWQKENVFLQPTL